MLCKFCSKSHFSFLCPNKDNQTSIKPNDKKVSNEVAKSKENNVERSTINSSLMVTSGLLLSHSLDYVILPTFTLKLNNKILRSLKDSGCQYNFILESIADSQNLKIIENNFQLTVNGFNSSKRYDSKVVEVPIAVGSKRYTINAVTIPEINIAFKLPQLAKVVKAFKSKNYFLADKYLLSKQDSIQNIEFILGSSCAYCMPEKMKTFGENPPSCFSFTSAGILLYGSIKNILRNLPSLPPMYKKPNTCLKAQASKICSDEHSSSEPSSDRQLSPSLVNDCDDSKNIDRCRNVEPQLFDSRIAISDCREECESVNYCLTDNKNISDRDLYEAANSILNVPNCGTLDQKLKDCLSIETEEVTGTLLLKGKTKVKIKRHVSSLKPLLTGEEYRSEPIPSEPQIIEADIEQRSFPPRTSAVKCKARNKKLAKSHRI